MHADKIGEELKKAANAALVRWARDTAESARMKREFLLAMYGLREKYLRRLVISSDMDDWSVYSAEHIIYAITRLTALYGYDWDRLIQSGRC